jgi:hypothetical protein
MTPTMSNDFAVTGQRVTMNFKRRGYVPPVCSAGAWAESRFRKARAAVTDQAAHAELINDLCAIVARGLERTIHHNQT